LRTRRAGKWAQMNDADEGALAFVKEGGQCVKSVN
jgi:hypothetical protein